MNATSSVPAAFVDGLAQLPASNSPPPTCEQTQEPRFLGPLCSSTQPLHSHSLGLVRAAGPAQLCD